MIPFIALFSNNRITVLKQNEVDSLFSDGYGFRTNSNELILEPFEALFLVEKKRIVLLDEEKNKNIVFQEILWQFSERDPSLWIRYIVYKDLRSRGFVAKKGPGLGVDFILWNRGKYGYTHPSCIVYVIQEGSPLKLGFLEKILDKTLQDEQILKLAVVDRQGEIVYYTLKEKSFNFNNSHF